MPKKKEIDEPRLAPSDQALLKTLRAHGQMKAETCVRRAVTGHRTQQDIDDTIGNGAWHRQKFAELEKRGLVRREFQTYALTDLGFELTRETPRPTQVSAAILEAALARVLADEGPAAALLDRFDIYPKVTAQFEVVGDFLFVEEETGAAEGVIATMVASMRATAGAVKLDATSWRLPRDREAELERALAIRGVGVRRTA